MISNYSQLLHHVAFLHHGAFSPEIKKINFKLIVCINISSKDTFIWSLEEMLMHTNIHAL